MHEERPMLDLFVFDSPIVSFPLAVFLYFQLLRYFDNLYFAGKPLTTEEYLAWLAGLSQKSEYDLFFVSAEEWHIPDTKIKEDFKDYLRDGVVPYYVEDFVRKARKKLAPD